MKKLHIDRNFIRYTFPYILILIFFFIGTYVTLNIQLKTLLKDNLSAKDTAKIEIIASKLDDNLLDIYHTTTAIEKDVAIILSRYDSTDYSANSAIAELKKYTYGNPIIEDVIYYNVDQESCISAYSYSTYNKEKDMISFNSKSDIDTFSIPMYLVDSGNISNKVHSIKNSKSTLNIVVPPIKSSRYKIVYILNKKELENILKMGLSENINYISITDDNGGVISSVGQSAENISSANVLKVPMASSGLSISYVFNYNFIDSSVNHVLLKSYLFFFAVILISIVVIAVFLKSTYTPLKKLATQFNLSSSGSSGNDIETIKEGINKFMQTNTELTHKVNSYRIFMQKSILEGIAKENSPTELDLYSQIDRLFDNSSSKMFFVVRFISSDTIDLQALTIKIKSVLNISDSCITLDKSDLYISFLINYNNTNINKDYLFIEISQSHKCKIAFSSISTNPMAIAGLYNEAKIASEYLSDFVSIKYDDIKDEIDSEGIIYPYKVFDEFSKCISDMDFDLASKSVSRLFDSIDLQNSPEFFIRCILIDIVTLIVTHINDAGIKPEKFNSIYEETLFLCRSSDYNETYDEIKKDINEMLSILFSGLLNTSMPSHQVKQFVHTNFCRPDFSLTMLADNFKVSDAYMSQIFKKKFNINLVDYIWELRLEKARVLLKDHNLTIDQISLEIGYDNASSFRRKFKSATGVSPSQYRKDVSRIL